MADSSLSERVKTCTECCAEKPATVEHWHKLKGGKYGLNSVCTACRRAREARRRAQPGYAEYYREWKAANPDKVAANDVRYAASGKKAATGRAYRSEREDALREAKRAFREANRDLHRARQARYRERNRDRFREYNKKWIDANPDKVAQNTRFYQCAKIRRTPPWLSAEDRAEMAAMYELARRLTLETGVPHEVDHIVPVRGAVASGLHVPWNLQVITAEENQRKGNRF